jgi:hypothetical protein
MSRGQDLRLKLFATGAKAASLHFKADQDVYICPLCGRGFLIQAVIDGTLTLEHVPPKSLGGKPLVLTCKDCNNDSGHSIDSAAALRKDMESIQDIILHGKEDMKPRPAEMIVG